jgi:hypothetical protein
MGVKPVGIITIITGTVFLIFFAFPFLFCAVGGWVADRGPLNFADWLTLFVLGRIFLGIFFLSFIGWVAGGIAAVRNKTITAPLTIIAGAVTALSGLGLVFSYAVNDLIFHRVPLDARVIFTALYKDGDYLMFYIPCAYAIFLIVYFSRATVKNRSPKH